MSKRPKSVWVTVREMVYLSSSVSRVEWSQVPLNPERYGILNLRDHRWLLIFDKLPSGCRLQFINTVPLKSFIKHSSVNMSPLNTGMFNSGRLILVVDTSLGLELSLVDRSWLLRQIRSRRSWSRSMTVIAESDSSCFSFETNFSTRASMLFLTAGRRDRRRFEREESSSERRRVPSVRRFSDFL